MNILILLRTSLRVLRKHKVRSFLTILGIMIGISAIIVTFSIGRGAEEAISSTILGMGEGTIYIMPAEFMKRGGLRSDVAQRVKLSTREMKKIKKNSPEIQEISPMQMTIQQMEYKQKLAQGTVIGCHPNMLKVNDNTLALGHFFNDYHLHQKSNVVILGSKMAKNLFNTEDPVGKVILVNKQPCKVIGVLDDKPHFWGPRDPNEWTYMPFTVSKKICRGHDESEDELTMIGIKPYPGIDSEVLLRKIKSILRFAYKTKAGEEDQFTIFDQKSIEEVARDAAGVIKLFGLLAAMISLLVGSIGVMNIMLVSVKERTREIGIRMAIGATQRSIRTQFLIESTILCLFGGAIGVMLGLLAQIGVSYVATLPVVIEFTPMVISLIVTIFIGVFFGYYPARQASLLNPVDALLERT
ncbi:ABC transporter permease [Candidatus Dependentiae bacterium]